MDLVRGLERSPRSLVVHFDQEQLVLGDTCSRLAYTKQAVASSNTNICDKKINICWSRWLKLGPAQPKPGPAQPKPGLGQILEIWGPGNPEMWGPKNKKSKFSKSKSVLPKMPARPGLVGKNPPGPIWGHPRPCSPWSGKIQNAQNLPIFLGGKMSTTHPVWGHVLVSLLTFP